jgi:hypothetical protein
LNLPYKQVRLRRIVHRADAESTPRVPKGHVELLCTVRREAPHMKVKRLNLPYKQVRLRRTVLCGKYCAANTVRQSRTATPCVPSGHVDDSAQQLHVSLRDTCTVWRSRTCFQAKISLLACQLCGFAAQ